MSDTPAPETMTASVPLNATDGVNLDASSLSKAIQSIIEQNTPTERRVNPATFIHESGVKMVELYAVYEKLRAIGTHLNGKLTSDPIPENLQIDSITINFRTVEGEQVSEPQAVELKHITTVGDLSGLLATELGAVIVTLQRETDAVLDIANRTKEMCDKSRKAWEEANKDKKILEEEVSEVADSPTSVAETVVASAEAAASSAS